jgi:dTMP kinase
MRGIFITFEGTEGSGKSTQIGLLAARLRTSGRTVRTLREPGGTPIGEEIRHLLKHSVVSHAMTPEAELLLLNASRAQLVREVIRPALASGEIVLCDRFYDSTIAYQGYGRGLDLGMVRSIIAAAVGQTRPDLTLVLTVPVELSEQRRRSRQQILAQTPALFPEGVEAASPTIEASRRDRIEEADRAFFERVEEGYREIIAADPKRVREIDATKKIQEVESEIWAEITRVWPVLAKEVIFFQKTVDVLSGPKY